MTYSNTAYENLANAIILRSVTDFHNAFTILSQDHRSIEAQVTISECEIFFRSKWFSMLTALDGEQLLEILRKECGV